MNHISGAERAERTADNDIFARLPASNAEAADFVAPDKVEHLARQWLSGVPWVVHEGHWAFAHSLALELALITPSVTGTTAFDRLARKPRQRSADDLAAIALLRRSQPCLARLSGRHFENLATGEKLTFSPTPPSDAVGCDVVFGRFAKTGVDRAIATGMLLRLDRDALAVAEGFVRPGGRGLGNPVRCAEAVYRYMVRRGMSAGMPERELPFYPDSDPLDALAAAWATLDREPRPEEIAAARDFVGSGPLLQALISVGIARDAGAKRLADAYRRISVAVIEFIAMREAYGSARFSLDRAAAEVDAAVARGQCRFETKALFNELRERTRLAARKAGGPTGDLDKLMLRIRALREKTVEQGCTEQEAMAAAEKVAELLDRYGLNLSELDLRKQSCEGIGVQTGRKRRGPIDDCMGTIAAFFDCRVWGETGEDDRLNYVFFGLPGDVQAAVYLHDLIVLAFASETATFQVGAFYGRLDSGQRRSATNSFQVGLALGIIRKLDVLRLARDASAGGSNGRALVPVKQAVINEEMERMGLTLRRVNATRRTIIPNAFNSGRKAGEKFEYRPGITGA